MRFLPAIGQRRRAADARAVAGELAVDQQAKAEAVEQPGVQANPDQGGVSMGVPTTVAGVAAIACYGVPFRLHIVVAVLVAVAAGLWMERQASAGPRT